MSKKKKQKKEKISGFYPCFEYQRLFNAIADTKGIASEMQMDHIIKIVREDFIDKGIFFDFNKEPKTTYTYGDIDTGKTFKTFEESDVISQRALDLLRKKPAGMSSSAALMNMINNRQLKINRSTNDLLKELTDKKAGHKSNTHDWWKSRINQIIAIQNEKNNKKTF